MGRPARGGHHHQDKPHDQQDHGHHFRLREIVVRVRHPGPGHSDHQRDDPEGEDAAVPGLLHPAGGLREPLQRGQHLGDFGCSLLRLALGDRGCRHLRLAREASGGAAHLKSRAAGRQPGSAAGSRGSALSSERILGEIERNAG